MGITRSFAFLFLLCFVLSACQPVEQEKEEQASIGNASEYDNAVSGMDLRDKMGENITMQATVKGTIMDIGTDSFGRYLHIDIGDGSALRVNLSPDVKIKTNDDMIGKMLLATGTALVDTAQISEVITHDPDDLNKPNKSTVAGDETEPDFSFTAKKVIIR